MFYRRVKSQDEAEGSLLVSGESAAIRERILELRKRLSQLEATGHLPNPALAVAFLGLLIIQGFHEAEQVVQVFQRFVLDIQNAKGLLGQYFDQEPLQFAYNILFFLLLVSVYALSGAHRPQLWSRGTAAWWLLTVGILIQGYHAIEHIFKIWQFVEFGRDGTPGILGNALHLMWLHFALNTTAYLPVIVAYWIGGFYRHLAADLIAGWNQVANQPASSTGVKSSPGLSRRALLVGMAGLVVAIGGARVAAALRRPDPEATLPIYEDITLRAGINFRHQANRRADTIQAGAAFIDVNGNGLPDIFLTNANGPNALYINNGDGTFTEIADEAGIADPDGVAIGVAAADYDNDGHCDILLTTLSGLKLFRNKGNGRFSDVTFDALLARGEGHPASAAWVDFNGDGHLDLYVTYWLDEVPEFRLEMSPDFTRKAYTAASRSHRLFQNNGNGTFTDVTKYLNAGEIHGAGLAVGSFDYDDDGRPDLYIVNDFGHHIRPNTLFRNLGPRDDGWAFREVGGPAGVDAAFHGMGVAVGDYDGDGRLDMFATNLGSNVLYRNRGDATFEEMTNRAGVGRAVVRGEDSSGWGTAFLDFDNDGVLDLYFVAGRLYPEQKADGNYPPDQPNALFHNMGDGTFRDVSRITSTGHTGCARGLAVGDIDGDGFLDMLVANYDQRPVLFRNRGNGNRWLNVQLAGTQSNRDGIGARLILTAGNKRQIREIQSGTSFLSQNSLIAHFGLGQVGKVDELEIRWPSGVVQSISNISADRTITVTEPT